MKDNIKTLFWIIGVIAIVVLLLYINKANPLLFSPQTGGGSGTPASGSGNPCTGKPDTTQCSSSTIKYGICKNGICVDYSCDNVFGSGSWDPCPPNHIKDGKDVWNTFPNCCNKGDTCKFPDDFVSGNQAACCPPDTIARSLGGYRYCLKTQGYCDRLYGTNAGWTPCVGICCKPGTTCKEENNRPKCEVVGVTKQNCPTGTFFCKGFSDGNLCCTTGKEKCMNLNSGVVFTPGGPGDRDNEDVTCIATSTGCAANEVYCPGVSTTVYKNFALCCPSGSKCAQHPDGTPNCVK